MAATLPELAALLGPELKDRPRFAKGKDGSLPYHVVVVDGAAVGFDDQFGADGVDGVTLIEVLGGPPGPADPAALRLQVTPGRLDMFTRDRAGADQLSSDRRAGHAVAGRGRGAGPGAGAAAAGRRPGAGRRRAGGEHHADRAARHRRPAGGGPGRAVAAAAGAQPAPRPDRPGRRRPAGRAGHQGVGAGRHGTARAGHRRDRVREVRAAPDAGAGPGADPSAGGAELRAGQLQGRRDVPRAGGSPARLGGDHEPGAGAAAGGPDAGRAARRADPPPGTAPVGGQLRVGPGLRAGPGARRRAGPAAHAVRGHRRVLRAAVGQAGVHRPVRDDRAAGPVARRAPAAGLAAAGGGPAARPGHPAVLPDRAAHVLRRRVADRARRAGRLRAAVRAGQRVPQGQRGRDDPVQGGLRVRPGRPGDHQPGRAAPAGAGDRAVRPGVHSAAGDPGPGGPARPASPGGRAGRARPAGDGSAGDAARPAGRPADRAGRGGPADLAAAAQPGARAQHAAAAAVHYPGRVHHRGPALARPAAGGHRPRGPAVRAAP